jgi:hypothetical protein
MDDILTKLRPDRDLQCYFFQPSAVAALSGATPNGFTLSGCWRQQFDWAVLEWNRDNVFEHPAIRNLPDGDLSGIHLSYLETRANCVPFDSTLYPTVDWPYLRVWADKNGQETIYQVPLLPYATPLSGSSPATAQFSLQGVITDEDYIELAWMDQHFNYQVTASDTLETAAGKLAGIITANQTAGLMTATAAGTTITLTYLGMPGANGNRIGAYATVHGACTESWQPTAAIFTGGVTPSTWRVTLDFSGLKDKNGVLVPTNSVRKLRWTWAADLQAAEFQRTEFSVSVSEWAVTGSNLLYSVAGPGSRRIEDSAGEVAYTGQWTEARGNYSGGSARWTSQPGSTVTCRYASVAAGTLYLGTRYFQDGASITIQADGGPLQQVNLALPGEDVLVRIPVQTLPAGAEHVLTVTHNGPPGSTFYFDFLELAIPTTSVPAFPVQANTTLATDWDTAHSQVLPPERTAWLLQKLGFQGRANHYAGCLWFYELVCPDQREASAIITFTGVPEFGKVTSVLMNATQIDHANLVGDTAETIAKCFELLINSGVTGVRARADGSALSLFARAAGSGGNGVAIDSKTNSSQFTAQSSSPYLSGGTDGKWLTDLSAMPRLNRGARDWISNYFRALKTYGIGIAVAFSMELGNGNDSTAAGIAQRYPDGTAAWLNTPALQTNFGPQSTSFWQQVYLDMATLMTNADIPVYLQFGEVQWWYFCPPTDPRNGNWTPRPNGGMPFYDDYTTARFQEEYRTPMHIFTDPSNDPTPFPNESSFLPSIIGSFTSSVQAAVHAVYPTARFEVLYPPDVNDAPLTRIVNLPTSQWTPANIACLKTENFTYTGNRDLNRARESVQLPNELGFAASQASHLIGIGDYTSPWLKEWSISIAAGLESVVLFALDQFCLIGYALPLDPGDARSALMGN